MLTLTFIVLTALLSGANADPDGDKRNELKELRAKGVNLEKGSELKRKGPVAFAVHLSRNNVDVGAKLPIKFDAVVSNIGECYNTQTGVFTAPANGVYIFSLQIMSEPGRGMIEVTLNINDKTHCLTRAEESSYDDGFCTTVVYLTKGSRVFAHQNWGGTYLHGGIWAYFSGAMLSAD